MSYQVASTKEIKQALKKHFNWNFSVTRGRGTAYHWIHVRWTDGPTQEKVNSFCDKFNDNERDDIMTDLWCGSQYTNVSRNYSPEYCFYLCNGLDLYKKPSLKAQMTNFFDVRHHRGCSRWSMGETEDSFDIKNEESQPISEVEYVRDKLVMQGYEVHISDDKTFFRVMKKGNHNLPHDKPQEQNKPIISEYKGHPTITLPCNGKGFTFGLAKATVIINYFDDIKAFVTANHRED